MNRVTTVEEQQTLEDLEDDGECEERFQFKDEEISALQSLK